MKNNKIILTEVWKGEIIVQSKHVSNHESKNTRLNFEYSIKYWVREMFNILE